MKTAEHSTALTGRPVRPVSQAVVAALDAATIRMPLTQMLRELQTVVERMSFGFRGPHPDPTMEDVEILLGTDVSRDMLTFALWMARSNLGGLLVGDNGRHFLSFCIRHYKTVKEIRVVTPIEARESLRNRILAELRIVHPKPARIIFETSASLVAGCVIDDGRAPVDMSLAAKMPRLINRYVSMHGRRKATARG